MPLPVTSQESTAKQPEVAASHTMVSVLAVGDWKQREFATAIAEINGTKSWQTVANIQSVYQRLTECDSPPELILLAQSIPGEYRQRDINQLCSLAPLSRVVVVAGTWCEGEMRTGSRLEGTIRLYWYEFTPWWRAALRNLAAGLCPPWSLPLDNPQSGRCFYTKSSAEKPSSGNIVIEAADFSVYETLAAAFANVGFKSVWIRDGKQDKFPTNIAAGIWDGGQLCAAELVRLIAFCKKIQAQHGKIVALLDFPRVEHVEQTRKAGASAVFGKPYIVDEIVAALL